jgi:hypothetical protein
MGIDDLLAKMQREAGTPGTPERVGGVPAKALLLLGCTLGTPGTPQNSNAGEKVKAGHSRQAETWEGLTRPYLSGVTARGELPTLAAEPIDPGLRQLGAPLAGDQETEIRSWLAAIGETDQEANAEVLTRCRQDEDARRYFLDRAGEVASDGETDDRRNCVQCGNLRGGVCVVARPGGLVSAIRGYRPVTSILQRCLAFLPAQQLANSL